MGDRFERREDGRFDVALERVARVQPGPVRAQRLEKARPDRAGVADEDPECRGLAEVREPKGVVDGAVVPGHLEWLGKVQTRWGASRPKVLDHALPGRPHARDYGSIRRFASPRHARPSATEVVCDSL